MAPGSDNTSITRAATQASSSPLQRMMAEHDPLNDAVVGGVSSPQLEFAGPARPRRGARAPRSGFRSKSRRSSRSGNFRPRRTDPAAAVPILREGAAAVGAADVRSPSSFPGSGCGSFNFLSRSCRTCTSSLSTTYPVAAAGAAAVADCPVQRLGRVWLQHLRLLRRIALRLLLQ